MFKNVVVWIGLGTVVALAPLPQISPLLPTQAQSPTGPLSGQERTGQGRTTGTL